MAFDTRVAVAREAVIKLTSGGLDPQELLHEAAERIRRVVPYDLGGWMTMDPDTLLPTGNIRSGKTPELTQAFWRNELFTPDVHKFTELVRRHSPVAVMSAVDVATAEDSPRRQLIHRPAGLGDEARVLLRANGSTWGAGASTARALRAISTPTSSGFSPRWSATSVAVSAQACRVGPRRPSCP
jgi:hypothetical protein